MQDLLIAQFELVFFDYVSHNHYTRLGWIGVGAVFVACCSSGQSDAASGANGFCFAGHCYIQPNAVMVGKQKGYQALSPVENDCDC